MNTGLIREALEGARILLDGELSLTIDNIRVGDEPDVAVIARAEAGDDADHLNNLIDCIARIDMALEELP